MSDQLEFAKSIALRFDENGIPYMYTGSFALSLYATPRMTRDLDLVVELAEPDTDRIVNLFEADCYVDRGMIRAAMVSTGLFHIIHRELVLKADFIIKKSDAYRQMEFSRRRMHDLDGGLISIVAPEDLILSKLVWAKDSRSALQDRDTKSLLNSVPDLDGRYLEEWANRLGVLETLKELRSK